MPTTGVAQTTLTDRPAAKTANINAPQAPSPRLFSRRPTTACGGIWDPGKTLNHQKMIFDYMYKKGCTNSRQPVLKK